MQLAYSAFYEGGERQDDKQPNAKRRNNYSDETLLRLSAHLLVCQKYSEEIKRIQQYLPHWQPSFRGDV